MKSRRGDTLVEVMFAVGIFGLVAVGAIGIMNKGLYDAQKTLEISMARNEIDAQAEALRFIHAAYVTEKNTTSKTYTKVWQALTSGTFVYKPQDLSSDFFSKYNNYTCGDIYSSNAFPKKSFIVNYRRLDNDTVKAYTGNGTSAAQVNGEAMLVYNASYFNDDAHLLAQTPTYPRLLFSNNPNRNHITDLNQSLSENDVAQPYYDKLTKAQGIWITAVAADNSSKPEFYDFYIRTCWSAPGSDGSMTISTTIRLFNPDR